MTAPAIDVTAVCSCGERCVDHRCPRTGRWITCLELRERRGDEAANSASADSTTLTNASSGGTEQALLHEGRF